MKRFVIPAAVLLLALMLALPWYVGRRTEVRYRELVGQTGGALSLRLEDYRRGWFSSLARLNAGLELGPLARRFPSLPARLQFTLADHIAHGPVPIAAEHAGERIDPALVRGSLAAMTPGSAGPVVTASYALGLDGSLSLALEAAPLNAGGWRWGGLDARLDTPSDGNALAAHLGTGPLAPVDGREGPSLGRLTLDVTGRRDGGGPWLGHMVASLARADGLPGGAALERAAFHARSAHRGETASLTLEGEIGALRQDAAGALGPGRFSLGFSGLDAAAMARLEESIARLAGSGLASRQLAPALAGATLAGLPGLLARGPELRLDDAHFQAPGGELTASGRLYLASTDAKVLNNPFLLQRALRGELNARAPGDAAHALAALFLSTTDRTDRTAEDWLASEVRAGHLRRDGEAYVLELRLAGGRLTAFGRPWSRPNR